MERTLDRRQIAEVGGGTTKTVGNLVGVDGGSPDGIFETAEELGLEGGVGEGYDEVVLGGAGGEELGVEAAEELVESRVVEGGRGWRGRSEAVAAAVLRGASLAFGGAGPGGALSVGAVGPNLGGRRHHVLLLVL
jgi:hypothetical protein